MKQKLRKWIKAFEKELLSMAMVVGWVIWITVMVFDLKADSSNAESDREEFKKAIETFGKTQHAMQIDVGVMKKLMEEKWK